MVRGTHARKLGCAAATSLSPTSETDPGELRTRVTDCSRWTPNTISRTDSSVTGCCTAAATDEAAHCFILDSLCRANHRRRSRSSTAAARCRSHRRTRCECHRGWIGWRKPALHRNRSECGSGDRATLCSRARVGRESFEPTASSKESSESTGILGLPVRGAGTAGWVHSVRGRRA